MLIFRLEAQDQVISTQHRFTKFTREAMLGIFIDYFQLLPVRRYQFYPNYAIQNKGNLCVRHYPLLFLHSIQTPYFVYATIFVCVSLGSWWPLCVRAATCQWHTHKFKWYTQIQVAYTQMQVWDGTRAKRQTPNDMHTNVLECDLSISTIQIMQHLTILDPLCW
uniref:Uncharacterized protein n=1 Tax=Arundo donax TaxID=35708 RepID=A0A0A9DY84_ARUDO